MWRAERLGTRRAANKIYYYFGRVVGKSNAVTTTIACAGGWWVGGDGVGQVGEVEVIQEVAWRVLNRPSSRMKDKVCVHGG